MRPAIALATQTVVFAAAFILMAEWYDVHSRTTAFGPWFAVALDALMVVPPLLGGGFWPKLPGRDRLVLLIGGMVLNLLLFVPLTMLFMPV